MYMYVTLPPTAFQDISYEARRPLSETPSLPPRESYITPLVPATASVIEGEYTVITFSLVWASSSRQASLRHMACKLNDLDFRITAADGKPFKFTSAADFPQLAEQFAVVMNRNGALPLLDAARRFHKEIQKTSSQSSVVAAGPTTRSKAGASRSSQTAPLTVDMLTDPDAVSRWDALLTEGKAHKTLKAQAAAMSRQILILNMGSKFNDLQAQGATDTEELLQRHAFVLSTQARAVCMQALRALYSPSMLDYDCDWWAQLYLHPVVRAWTALLHCYEGFSEVANTNLVKVILELLE